jgi:hypothetical protein
MEVTLCSVLQGHHGQREAECSAVSAASQPDLPGPGPHGGVDRPRGAPAQRPAPGKAWAQAPEWVYSCGGNNMVLIKAQLESRTDCDVLN